MKEDPSEIRQDAGLHSSSFERREDRKVVTVSSNMGATNPAHKVGDTAIKV
jgi:hypothetical protein